MRYFIPNTGVAGRIGRFIGVKEMDYGATVAVDGMHELRSEYRDEGPCSYYGFNRADCSEVRMGRFASDAEAIGEWRRMLREGEI